MCLSVFMLMVLVVLLFILGGISVLDKRLATLEELLLSEIGLGKDK